MPPPEVMRAERKDHMMTQNKETFMMLGNINVPGGRFWEPMNEVTESQKAKEWDEFEQWIKAGNDLYDQELPFN